MCFSSKSVEAVFEAYELCTKIPIRTKQENIDELRLAVICELLPIEL